MKAKFEISNIKTEGDDIIKIRGEMTFDTVVELMSAIQKLIKNTHQLVFDLSGITRSDSAGLALMIDLFKRAQHKKRDVYFLNPPKQLLAIANVCGVENFLPFKQR